MALSARNKISINLNSIGMTDVFFNLLLFFMLTSTLVHPTALRLNLPKGSVQIAAKPQTTVSITKDLKLYIENQPITFDELEEALKQKVGSNPDIYISLHTDESVPIGVVTKVLNIAQKNNYKLILATSPK
ncbi:MAG: biopolymer transporter ExbD [Bacteroidales bacterium]|nr:biopolymer transporter ExbD [Bacteroidales bacterium]